MVAQTRSASSKNTSSNNAQIDTSSLPSHTHPLTVVVQTRSGSSANEAKLKEKLKKMKEKVHESSDEESDEESDEYIDEDSSDDEGLVTPTADHFAFLIYLKEQSDKKLIDLTLPNGIENAEAARKTFDSLGKEEMDRLISRYHDCEAQHRKTLMEYNPNLVPKGPCLDLGTLKYYI